MKYTEPIITEQSQLSMWVEINGRGYRVYYRHTYRSRPSVAIFRVEATHGGGSVSQDDVIARMQTEFQEPDIFYQEVQQPVVVSQVITPLILFYSVLQLIALAFTSKSRIAIRERDNNTCQWCHKSHSAENPVEAAHIHHDRSRADYNDPSNGQLLCVFPCHLSDHLVRHGDESLGMTEAENLRGLRMLVARCLSILKRRGET